MSTQKTIKTRIQHKHDIEANWIKATNFVPLAGELIIYDAETTSTSLEGTGRTTPITYTRFKFGNGTTPVTDLAFSASPVDWDQNDSQASDYIKNRTHYTDDNGTVYTLDPKYIPVDGETIYIKKTGGALEPGAYTSDGTFSNLEYTWEQMIANGPSYTNPYVYLEKEEELEFCGEGYDIVVPETQTITNWVMANTIVLPSTTTSIYGTDDKSYVNKMYIKATTPPTLIDTFEEGYIPEIIVPEGSKETYIADTNWVQYAAHITEGSMPGEEKQVLVANIPADVNTTYILSKVGNVISLNGSDGSVTTVTDESGSDGLIYTEEATQTTRTLTTPPNITIDEEHIFCYGDGKLVCLSNEPNVGSEATVTYSEDDGTTWREGTWSDPLAADKTCPGAVVYGDGIFLGGWSDTESYIIRSTDGINWEIIAITGFSGEHCSALYFHNHKFYCKGDGGTLFRSDDGITWESFFEPGPGGIHNIAFGEDKILVAEYDSPTLTILDYLGDIVDTHDFAGNILGLYCYENRFYVNTDDSSPLYTSTDGTSWRSVDILSGLTINALVYLNGKYFIESGEECYLFDPVAEQVTLLTDGIQYSFISSYIVEDRYALTIEDTDIYGTIDGYTWTNPIIVYSYIKQLQQGGEDVTAKVAAIIGGNGGGIIGNEIETLTITDNLTVSGNFTLEGDFVIGDLDASTVTLATAPTEDNHAVTKKYMEEYVENALLNGTW